MKEMYEAAMKKSFIEGDDWQIPFIDSTRTIATRPHGAQTLGIHISPVDGNAFQLVVADYFMPSFFSGIATHNDEGLLFTGNAIRGVNHGTNSVRIFPFDNIPGDLPRCQTINPGPENTLFATRNGDKKIFILIPPEDPNAPDTEPESKWDIWGRSSVDSFNSSPTMIHSLLVEKDTILTIESGFIFRNDWRLCEYKIADFIIGPRRYKMVINNVKSTKIPDFTYGIVRAKDGSLLFITDFRATNQNFLGLKEHGIYKGPSNITNGYIHEMEMVYSKVWGNGLGLIERGVLISVYGMAEPGPFNGEPGRFVFLPKL